MRHALEHADRNYFRRDLCPSAKSMSPSILPPRGTKAVHNAVACLENLPDNEVRFAMRELAEQSIARLN